MSLDKYIKKRKFEETPEPTGTKKAGRDGKIQNSGIFVVQKHNASHLHFDFRLESEGVLKSWAVPKGPSINHNDKRLAIEVEDHPLDYAKFHGVIPEGNYGAGTVEIWDKGRYKTKFKDEEMWEFYLTGKKLNGMFTLVRLKNRGVHSIQKVEEKNWLLIKKKGDAS